MKTFQDLPDDGVSRFTLLAFLGLPDDGVSICT